MDRDYRLCHLVGGRDDGDILALQLSHFPDGSVYAVRTCEAHPDHGANQ